MKAPAFTYARPSTLAQVFDLLERHGDDAKILAGGQSLLPSLNMRLSSPRLLVDITAIAELTGISIKGATQDATQGAPQADVLRIGALTTHAQLAVNTEVQRHASLLAHAAPHIAHPAIRNAGTFGGSIAMADPAAELPACAVALNAQLVLASRSGERRVAASEFFKGLYDTALKAGEVLVAAEINCAGANQRSVFLELARRRGDYAIVGLAACANISRTVGGDATSRRFADVKLVFLSVSNKPFDAKAAAAAVSGQSVADLATVSRAAQQALAGELAPDADLYNTAATKLHLARVLAGRAIAALAAQ